MITKHYAAAYAMLFIICLLAGLFPIAISGRFDALPIIVVLVVAVVVPPLLIWIARRMGYPIGEPIHCSRCGTEMPMFRKPSSLRQGLLGGYNCRNCGALLDARGNEIRTETARS
jgi:hypothetical protein